MSSGHAREVCTTTADQPWLGAGLSSARFQGQDAVHSQGSKTGGSGGTAPVPPPVDPPPVEPPPPSISYARPMVWPALVSQVAWMKWENQRITPLLHGAPKFAKSSQ